MSMQRGCEVIELEPGKWFCVVACAEHDYDFQSATVYGPAQTADDAWNMMSDWEANPGGCIQTRAADVTDRDRRLIANSRQPFKFGSPGWDNRKSDLAK